MVSEPHISSLRWGGLSPNHKHLQKAAGLETHCQTRASEEEHSEVGISCLLVQVSISASTSPWDALAITLCLGLPSHSDARGEEDSTESTAAWGAAEDLWSSSVHLAPCCFALTPVAMSLCPW